MKNYLNILQKVRSIITNLRFIGNSEINVQKGKTVRLNSPYNIVDTSIGDYTYIGCYSIISNTSIGKFCSIGLNFISGGGIHPVNGISTAPMFYSTKKQNGISLTAKDKIEERKNITIGNDVFIGNNVTILDGITIGDGAIIGAGAVVSKNIPAYAIAVGVPIAVINFRFNEETIAKLKLIKWWNFPEEKLSSVEKYFFDIDVFLSINQK